MTKWDKVGLGLSGFTQKEKIYGADRRDSEFPLHSDGHEADSATLLQACIARTEIWEQYKSWNGKGRMA